MTAISTTAIHRADLRAFATRHRIWFWLAAAGCLVWFARPDWFWAAAGVTLFGELLQIWAASCLEKNEVLCVRGPYTLVRNPMYLGRFFVLLGLVLLLNNPTLLLVYVVGFAVYAVDRVNGEERRLLELFGERYAEYRAAVPRFLPVPGRTYRESGSPIFFRWDLVRQNDEHRNLVYLMILFVLLKIELSPPF